MKKQPLIAQRTEHFHIDKHILDMNATATGAQLLANWACSALNVSNGIWFSLMWTFVGVVSTYDGYLSLRYWDSMPMMERNPICLYLMSLGDGDATFFLRIKAAGTVLVLAAMAMFYLRDPRLAQRIAWGVSSFQFGLLLYLTWGWS